jgi:CRP-like cAMP-binding protein
MPTNAILASLSPGDSAALRPYLRTVHLQSRKALFRTGDTVSSVYFPIAGIISLLLELSTGEVTECAMVGKDGVVGASAALDGKIALNSAVVQLPGEAIVCDANAFKSTVLQSQTLISTIMRHEQMMFVQSQQSTACMANHDIEARLCRWLLRARDLAGSDHLPFTQEFLAQMLGVRRTSVTTVAHTLQRAGMIRYSRGKIQIVDVEGLQETACECYEALKDHYERLLGQSLRKQ